MRPTKSTIVISILIFTLWIVAMISLLATQGIFPCFFEPEWSTITMDIKTEELRFLNSDLEIQVEDVILTAHRYTDLSIKASSDIAIWTYSEPVLDLPAGRTETFTYMATETIEISRAEILATDARFYLAKKDAEQAINLSNAAAVEISAHFNPGDPIVVWLSNGATIRIHSLDKEFGYLYVTPKDHLKQQELFEVTEISDNETHTTDLSITADSIQGNLSFNEFSAINVDGVIESDKEHILRLHDEFRVRSYNPQHEVALIGENESTFEVETERLYGKLWINNVPIPMSVLDIYLRAGVASGGTVIIAILSIYLKNRMWRDRSPTEAKLTIQVSGSWDFDLESETLESGDTTAIVTTRQGLPVDIFIKNVGAIETTLEGFEIIKEVRTHWFSKRKILKSELRWRKDFILTQADEQGNLIQLSIWDRVEPGQRVHLLIPYVDLLDVMVVNGILDLGKNSQGKFQIAIRHVYGEAKSPFFHMNLSQNLRSFISERVQVFGRIIATDSRET